MKSLEKNISLRISECDFCNTWRPGAILTELQEIAGAHSAALGNGRGHQVTLVHRAASCGLVEGKGLSAFQYGAV